MAKTIVLTSYVHTIRTHNTCTPNNTCTPVAFISSRARVCERERARATLSDTHTQTHTNKNTNTHTHIHTYTHTHTPHTHLELRGRFRKQGTSGEGLLLRRLGLLYKEKKVRIVSPIK
jgi:hypothetical protein